MKRGRISSITVEGSSLLGLCRRGALREEKSEASELDSITWRSYIHGEHNMGMLSNHYVTDGKVKYAWFSQTGNELLFDLTEDPLELRNLAGDPAYAEVLVMWRDRLVSELSGREEGYVADRQLVIGRPPRSCLSHILV